MTEPSPTVPARKPAPLPLRLLRLALAIIAAVALIYLGGANLILNTSVLDPLILKKEQKLLVEWESGWTVWPGSVHIRGFRYRGQTKAQQFQVRLAEGHFRLDLLPFASKTVVINSGRGGGFEFYMRRRLDHPNTKPGAGDFAPPIDGLGNPPDPPPEDIYAPPKNPDRRRWTLDISDVELDGAIDLWIAQLRLQGDGFVAGNVQHTIGQELALPDVRFDVGNAAITLGGSTLVEELDLDVTAQILPFVPKETRGTKIFNYLLGKVVLDNATVPDMTALNLFLPNSGLLFRSGTADVSLKTNKESIEAGSQAEFSLAGTDLGLSFGGQAVYGDVAVEAQLLGGGIGTEVLDIGGASLRLDNILFERNPEQTDSDDEGLEITDELWWARVDVGRGTVGLSTPSTVDLTGDFEMKDTGPLLNLFLARPSKDGTKVKIPLWARAIPNVRDMTGRGSVDIDDDLLVLDDIVIEGNKLEMMARLKNQSEGLTGHLYVRYGILRMGVELDQGETSIRMRKPRQWFLEQEEYDDSTLLEPPAERETPAKE